MTRHAHRGVRQVGVGKRRSRQTRVPQVGICKIRTGQIGVLDERPIEILAREIPPGQIKPVEAHHRTRQHIVWPVTASGRPGNDAVVTRQLQARSTRQVADIGAIEPRAVEVRVRQVHIVTEIDAGEIGRREIGTSHVCAHDVRICQRWTRQLSEVL